MSIPPLFATAFYASSPCLPAFLQDSDFAIFPAFFRSEARRHRASPSRRSRFCTRSANRKSLRFLACADRGVDVFAPSFCRVLEARHWLHPCSRRQLWFLLQE